MQLVNHVLAVIAREGTYSIEIPVESQSPTLSTGFWEGKQFVCTPILPCGREVSPTKGYFDLVSRLLSAISSDATIICCGGSSVVFVKVLDKNPGQKVGVQCPLTLTPIKFERLQFQCNGKFLHVFNFSNLSSKAEGTIGRTLSAVDTVI